MSIVRFRPLSGIRFWKTWSATSSTLVHSEPGGFRPLSGIRFWKTRTCDSSHRSKCRVSVPFRGLGSEKRGRLYLHTRRECLLRFRPLSGIRFWKTISPISISLDLISCFRPLSGIRFWKTSDELSKSLASLDISSFRPLSGIRFWKTIHSFPSHHPRNNNLVSVPFRGLGSEKPTSN